MPFYWTSQPSLSFVNGTSGSQDLAQSISNPQGYSLTYSILAGSLPSGCTLSGSQVVYNGSGAVGSSSVRFKVQSGDYSAETGNSTVQIQVWVQAPVFTQAPTSQTLSSSGGTIQFAASASTTIVYSLTQTRTGITINSSTGLVTVTAVAQGTNGAITVRATASGLYTEVQCVVDVKAYVGGGVWQKPSGYYMPAKLPMQTVFPRPDNETNTWARPREAYTGEVYRFAVGVAFGAWPFRYEIVAGPAGMTIGEQYGSPDYGIVSWVPDVSDTGVSQTVTVRVYDQDYGRGSAAHDVTWTVIAGTLPADFPDNKGFLFIDPVNGHAWNDPVSPGTGTKANPFLNSRDWYRDDPLDSTFYGYHIIWRGGTQYLYFDPNSGNPGNGEINHPKKSIVWYSLPNDSMGPARLNFSGAKAICQESVDVFVGDLYIEHSRRMNAQHFFFFYAKSMTKDGTAADSSPDTLGYRHTFWNNHWSYHYPSDKDTVNYPVRPTGPTAGENTAAVWTIGWPSDGGVTKHRRFYWYFADNSYNNFSTTDPDTGLPLWQDNGCPPAELCQAHKVLVERNRTDGWNNFSSVTYHKTTSSEMCYRANDWWLPGVDGSGSWETNLSEAYEDLRDDLGTCNIEFCWNRVYTVGSSNTSSAYLVGYTNNITDTHYGWTLWDHPVWVYRNTICLDVKGYGFRVIAGPDIDPTHALPDPQAALFVENNVVVAKDSDGFFPGPPSHLSGHLKMPITDIGVRINLADGTLMGTAASLRGTTGHEVV